MPREFSRPQRVAEQLQRELSVLIREEIQDPRLGLVSLSAVEVSRDLSHAKVYFSTYGEKDEQQRSLDVLKRASGHLRHLLGRILSMRSVPQLRFILDLSLEQGAHMSALINQAVKSEHK